MTTSEDLDRAISDLETSLERLQALYNQYFMGIEKLEPTAQRQNVERKLKNLRNQHIPNTALRFRLQTQIQKYNTQSIYWRRVCKQIEEGTYKRHVQLAKRRRRIKEERAAALEETRESAPFDDLGLDLGGGDSDDAGAGLDEPFEDTRDDMISANQSIDSLDDPFADDSVSVTYQGMPSVPPPPPPKAQEPSSPSRSGVPKPQDNMFDEEELQSFFSRSMAPPPPPGKLKQPAIAVPSTPEPEKEPAQTSSPGPDPAASPTGTRREPIRPQPRIARPKPAASTPTPGERTQSGLDMERARVIHRTYLAARKRCNETTDNITLEKIVKSLDKQYASKGGDVDFKVVIRNGKAAIKTVKK